MARLGELLVAAKLLTPTQVQLALRAQVVWGGRFGTNLVELGYLDLDALARALGRQLNLPAALARHFDKSDPELQQRISPAFAERWSIVPLLRVGTARKLAIASLDPLDDRALAKIADELMLDADQLVISIAAELRIRYHLERVYNIPRATRFLRSKGQSVTTFPSLGEVPVPLESDPEVVIPIHVDEAVPEAIPHPSEPRSPQRAADLAAMIDEATAHATRPSAAAGGHERRTYVRTLADLAEAGAARPDPKAALARIAIRKVVIADATAEAPIATLHDAIRKIRRSAHRDRVAELVIDAVDRFAPGCDAAVLFVIRGGVATGWKWFCRSGATPPELAVPMDQPGLVPAVVANNTTMRGRGDQLGAIDRLLLHALGKPDGDLVTVPISIAGRVMCLLATATAVGAPVDDVEEVAAAAATAFARLIRDASR